LIESRALRSFVIVLRTYVRSVIIYQAQTNVATGVL